jgi:hypothetical protein
MHFVFLDHCQYTGEDKPGLVECEVFGRITALSREAYEVASWKITTGDRDENWEVFGILRSSIRKATVLRKS